MRSVDVRTLKARASELLRAVEQGEIILITRRIEAVLSQPICHGYPRTEFERLERPSEIHDRLIVATARVLNAPLISADREIRATGQVETIW